MSSDQYGSQNPSNDPYGQQSGDPYGQGSYGADGSWNQSNQSNSWGDPVGQRSAGYVEGGYGQPGPAQSQSSAAYGADYGQQASHQSAQSQHSAAAPAGAAQWQPQGQAAYPTPANDEDNFLKAMFDFGFRRYATPSLVKVYYILGIVLGGLYWIGGALFMMVAGSAASAFSRSNDGSGAVMGFLWLIIGAPVFFFYIMALRVQLEMMLAMVRTNQDTKVIRARVEQG